MDGEGRPGTASGQKTPKAARSEYRGSKGSQQTSAETKTTVRLKTTGRVFYITDNYIKGYFTETRPISGCGEIFLKR